ncbi:MAG: NAD(P)/FAD-dependent oxidoreductase [Pseudomonadota bacterium]
MRRPDALIAGGGPAGAAVALQLARAGRRPLLVDRQRERADPVCGGFMGGDAIASLAALGIDVQGLGAHPITRARIFAGRRVAEAPLPFQAAGLSRACLDEHLLTLAAAAGAGIERGVTIRQAFPDRLTVDLADGASLTGDALFLATGKHELRGAARPVAMGNDPALGLRTRLEPGEALRHGLTGVIELHLFRHGYAGLLLQEDGGANLCLSVAQSRLKAAGGDPARLIEEIACETPVLGDRFAGATSVGPWASIARVPYGWRARQTTPGLFRLGDQAAVIASLAGDGVAIALASAARAARDYLREGPAGAVTYQPGFARQTARPVLLAESLRRTGERPMLAGALLALLGQAPGLITRAAALTRTDREEVASP